MNLVRSVLFNLLFMAGTLVAVILIPAAAPFSPKWVRRFVHAWTRYHHWLVENVLRIHSRWEGEIPKGPHLIAVKHQSMMEAIDTLRFADMPVVVMKRELGELPLWGKSAKAYGIIPVDREAGASALRDMLAQARVAATSGRPVIIFPEGTRVPVGETPPLRPGFAGLYRALGLPVVPIAHDMGTLWGRGLVHKAGVATFRVGEVIPPGLKREEIEARVHAAINALER